MVISSKDRKNETTGRKTEREDTSGKTDAQKQTEKRITGNIRYSSQANKNEYGLLFCIFLLWNLSGKMIMETKRLYTLFRT